MFGAQTQWPETRKRAREDEEPVNGVVGFEEHRSKRLHSLPFRISPTAGHKRWHHAPIFSTTHAQETITPADSDSEDQWTSRHMYNQQAPSAEDTDTDMMGVEMDGISTQHPSPLPSQHDSFGPCSRMPTPIHCTFASQIRGSNWPMAVQAQAMREANQASNNVNGYSSFPDPSVPRTLDHNPDDWSMVQNRRLPSPISESGGEEAASPDMVLDSCAPMSQLSLHRPMLPHMPHSIHPALHPNLDVTPPPGDGDSGMMDSEQQDVHSPSSAPATPSPRGKFGHSRSKHTVNSWTLQPGMKKSFSIGYRADCEKCRLKIPGHFNHIIVS